MVYLKEEIFGEFLGNTVKKFTWQTDSGFSVSAINYGACITSIKVPDKNNVIKDVALGFDDLAGYVHRNDPHRIGAVVGRCMGRIANGSFQLDGTHYQLSKNLGQHHLHGGFVGFEKVFWLSSVDGTKVTFSYLSPDGQEGGYTFGKGIPKPQVLARPMLHKSLRDSELTKELLYQQSFVWYPGDLVMNISYEVTDDGTLQIEYVGTTTKTTIVNPSQHSYFNLAGHETGAKQLYEHVVTLNCDGVLEGDKDWIPTGRILPVGGTPFDLRASKRLGDVIDEDEIRFHHNFCVATHGSKDLNFVARAVHPPSGRYMEVHSDQPGLLFFTAYYLPSRDEPPVLGKESAEYRRHAGFCMETQAYVDAINHPNFPQPVLKPGQVYRHRTKYSFGVVKGACFNCH